METQTKNGLIVTGVVALVVVGSYFGYKHFFPDAGNTDFADNYAQAQTNLNVKAGKGGIVIPFNNKKNKAQFYDNGRIVIFNDKGAIVKKGTYSDGGKTIAIDNGKTVSSGSVFGNLLAVIK